MKDFDAGKHNEKMRKILVAVRVGHLSVLDAMTEIEDVYWKHDYNKLTEDSKK